MLHNTSICTALVTVILSAIPLHAQQKPPVRIGVLLPFTGPFAAIAPEQMKGMRLAVKEFGGEVSGRKVELISEDTGGSPATGLTKARKLVTSDQVDMIVGIVSSPVALQVAPYLTSLKMPLVISNAGADSITGKNCSPYVFRASYSSAQIAKPVGMYLARQGVKRVFILGSDYVAPREFVAAIKEAFVAGGGEVVGEAWAPFGKTQDYGPYIAQARSANADAIIPIFFGSEAILFIKQWASFGIKNLPMYTAMGLTPPMLRNAQGDAALDVVSTVPYLSELDTLENKKFVAEFRKEHGTDPEEFAVMGYDAMRFALEGVKAVKGDTTDRPALADAISKVTFTGPRGPMSMNPSNNSATQNIYVVRTIKSGSNIGFRLLDTIHNYPDQVTGCALK